MRLSLRESATTRRWVKSIIDRRLDAVGALAFCLLFALRSPSGHAQAEDLLYTAIDLGPWGGPRFTLASRASVSNPGHVAARGVPEGFRWEAGSATNLGLLTNGTYSAAHSINDHNQIAGTGTINNNAFLTRAFRWQNGSLLDLGTLTPDCGSSQAQGINDQGSIVGGSCEQINLSSPNRAFLWESGTMYTLGTLPVGNDPTSIETANSFAYGINDLRQIVGSSDTAPAVEGPLLGPSHAFLWSNGTLLDLGTLGGETSTALAINNLGQIVGVALTEAGEPHAFLWQNGVMEDLGTLGGFESVAEGINDLGQIVGYSQTAEGRFHAFLYENGVMKDLNNLIDNPGDPPWEFVRATGINSRGDITGLVENGSRRVFVARKLCRDTDGNGNADNDGDALCDNWETDGIDVNGDGIIDLQLYDVNKNGVIEPGEDADPNHKDMYVEIDWMALHPPLLQPLQQVVNVFAAAPVPNPDGTTGIRLHLVVDEQAALHSDLIDFDIPPGPTLPHFNEIKDERFGTAAERSSLFAEQRLAAKRLAFRYVLYAHNHSALPGSSGMAEVPGNDMIMTLGEWAMIDGHKQGNVDQQAGTFLHEFGHMLNLRHGGSDDFNCKPNYLSVMSYSRQMTGAPLLGRQLDLSRQALPALDENAGLSEPAGIGGPPGYQTSFGPEPLIIVPANQPINWNRDADSVDVGISADINKLTTEGCKGLGTLLVSHDDWANIQYDFRSSSDFADGVHATLEDEDPDMSLDEALEMSWDYDGDSVTNLLDNCMLVANPGQADADEDGFGDDCDECPAGACPAELIFEDGFE